MVTWAVMVYSGKADVTHLAGWTWFTSLIFIQFFCLLWRNLSWFLKTLCGTIQPDGHEIHESFNSLIQDKFQQNKIKWNDAIQHVFSGQAFSQKGKGQVKGNVCRQSCASLALAHQMFHIPCRPERNPDHPEAMLPDSKTLWSRLTLILNLTQRSCPSSTKAWGLRQEENCIFYTAQICSFMSKHTASAHMDEQHDRSKVKFAFRGGFDEFDRMCCGGAPWIRP